MHRTASTDQIYALYQTRQSDVYIDTRQAPTGGIFIAVGKKDARGCSTGNRFARQALDQCAAALVVMDDPELYADYADDPRCCLVADGEQCLQELAALHRRHLDIPVLAVAGSNGKTTTRRLIELVLGRSLRVFGTPGNWNNHLGLPLSLLRIRPAAFDIAVLEIGANHLGETRRLAQIAAPTMGLVTNCGKDHLGEYGSLENIIAANVELYEYLAENKGLVFVNAGDELLVNRSAIVPKRRFYGRSAEVEAEVLGLPELRVLLSTQGQVQAVQTRFFGSFWTDAIAAAAAVGLHFGLPLDQIGAALESYTPDALRSQWTDWRGLRVLLDCYNANPSSMEVFLREVHRHASRHDVLLLGEMLELGDFASEEHQTLLDNLQPERFAAVTVVGESFMGRRLPPGVLFFERTEQAADWLHAQTLHHQARIFVKGSRGNRLESVFVS